MFEVGSAKAAMLTKMVEVLWYPITLVKTMDRSPKLPGTSLYLYQSAIDLCKQGARLTASGRGTCAMSSPGVALVKLVFQQHALKLMAAIA